MSDRNTDMAKLRPAEQLQVVLDTLDFSWTKAEMKQAKAMWRQGKPLTEIAEAVRGSGDDAVDETFLLLFHLARRGRVEARGGGVYGESDRINLR